ncbi:FkbM family methyltransferase [uncultured Litoreibacter sp.]|uniref:FkbM family methyltransferase n=1 Tax=uncultured Litoreibacter sp. TaxID=1392394 RepID=UPI0026255B9F|nr:FkbM family methyltransferase [uncultured Litoreibacter sp.]
MGLRRYFRKQSDDVIQPEERRIISKCVAPGDVVFDVGAHHGLWSKAVLEQVGDVDLHVFEATKGSYEKIVEQLGDKGTINHAAASHTDGEIVFNTYRDDDRLSSIYRRTSVEDDLLPAGFEANAVPAVALDSYWTDPKKQINLLKIDVEGAEYDVLRGANRLLKAGQVDYIQFEYGGTFEDAGFTLGNVWSYLRRSGYAVFKVGKRNFTEIERFTPAMEDYRYANLLAVHERLRSRFVGKPEDIVLYVDKMKRYGFKPKGVLHVGAHQGQELPTYRTNKMSPIVFVEANPELAGALRDKTAGEADIHVVEGAASDKAGTATFNIASMDQSSSLLPLAKHAELYPKITFDKEIEVRTMTLDAAMAETGVDPASVNMLTMDIQGAELMALRGATETLKHIDAIQTEINYDELYEGCPHISDLDAFLYPLGFLRIKTMTPYDKGWGDAVYVKAPMITNSVLGSMGRFANKAFQYMFLRTYAAEHGFEFANLPWEGDDMYHVRPGKATLPKPGRTVEQTKYGFDDCDIVNAPEPWADADLKGFFQYNMKYYAPYRAELEAEFAHKGVYLEAGQAMRVGFDALAGPVAVVHLRRGDYGTDIFFLPPNDWYVDWLRGLQAKEPTLQVYIATDDPTAAGNDFDEFALVTSDQLDLPPVDHGFFYDFTAMRLADHVAIANSSFSFLAAALNSTATSTVRPDPEAGKLVAFEPWSSDPLIRSHKAEEMGEDYMSARAKSRTKYKTRKFIKGLLPWGGK